MKIGICSAGYISRYGLEKGAERMASHGYECLDYSGLTFSNSPSMISKQSLSEKD